MASNNLMDNLQVDLQISPDLQRLIRDNANIAPLAIKKGLSAVARTGAKNVRSRMREGDFKNSGKLIKSVRASTTNKKSSYGSNAFYARFLEVGAKPHQIKTKNKSILWFGRFFAHKVSHPGIPAFEFFKRTQEELESSGQMKTLFDDAVRAAIEAVQHG